MSRPWIINGNPLHVYAHCTLKPQCPHCGKNKNLRKKAKIKRTVHHEAIGKRNIHLHIQAYKFHCLGCNRYFNQRLLGIKPRYKGSQSLKEQVFELHINGVSQSAIEKRFGIAQSTLERWFDEYYDLENRKLLNRQCPTVLGIDEHSFNKHQRFSTTLCDLRKHKVFDVVPGKSKAELHQYFMSLKGRERVQVVCIDLSSSYRSIVKHYFPNAKIVADRFHVIRLMGQSMLKAYQSIDPSIKYQRGMLNILRKREDNLTPKQIDRRNEYFETQPVIKTLYQFKNQLHQLMLKRHKTMKQCKNLIPIFLKQVKKLKQTAFNELQTLGQTLYRWREEIVRMWRFTKSNGITEGFHRKMKLIQRRAYGFRNFENYRKRVRLLCA